MFKFFKNIGKVNKVWKLLNETYFNALDGKTGNTVIKIEEKSDINNYLLVQTDNGNVKTILLKNEQEIINTLRSKYNISLIGIRMI